MMTRGNFSPMRSQAQVIICGGSLAGAATAIRLQQLGIPSCLIEKQRFPRKKLCGEFLGPDALRVLQRLGILPEIRSLAGEPIYKANFYTQVGTLFSVHMAWINADMPYALAIPRERLDAALLDAACSLGVSVFQPYRLHRQISKSEDHFCYTLEDIATRTVYSMASEFLVDASGRHGGLSLLGGTCSKETKSNRSSKLLGAKAHVRLNQSLKTDPLHMFLFPGGYGGLQPLGKNTANLCMLIRLPLPLAMDFSTETWILDVIRQNPVAHDLLQDAVLLEPILTTANLNIQLQSPLAGDLIRVGDAMITVEPMTGSGMALALETGLLAADTIAEGFRQGWAYEAIQKDYLRRYYQRYGLRLQVLKMMHPFLLHGGVPDSLLELLKPFLPLLCHCLR